MAKTRKRLSKADIARELRRSKDTLPPPIAKAVIEAQGLGKHDAAKREIDEVCGELGDDELVVVAHLARRLLLGQRQYGSINLANDPRDFRRERSEEISDLLVYTAFMELRHSVP